MKTKVIKFKKTANWRLEHPFDTAYSTVTGATIINWAMDTLLQYNGFVCSFRDKDRLDLLKCKLVITIPEENYTMFVKDFLSTFNSYVEKVSW